MDERSYAHRMTEAPSVRNARPAERTALEELQRRASLNNEGDREALLANPDAIALPPNQIEEGRVFVAERRGSIVGFAAVEPRQDGQTELDGLFVDPGAWRGGIGRALVDHCCLHARSSGAKILHVIGNPHAADFYRACGFETVGTQETQFGVGLLMSKRL